MLVLGVADLADHYRAFKSSVVRDLPSGLFQSAANDAHAHELIALSLDSLKSWERSEQRSAAAGYDAFLNGRTSGVHGVLYTSLLFLQFGFGCRAHLDQRNAAHKLCQTLLKFLAVVLRRAFLDLSAELLDATLDFSVFSRALDNCGVVLVDDYFFRVPQVFDFHVLQVDTQILGDGFAAGQEGAVIVGRIRESKDDNFGYNAETEEFGDLVKAGVIDPAKVTRLALQNAASIAGLMLTTEALIADIKEEAKSGAGAGAGGGMPGGGGMGGMY